MKPRTQARIAVAVAVSLGLAAIAVAQDAPPDNRAAAAVAERLALAGDHLLNDRPTPASIRAGACLLELARQANPKEVRHARAAAEAWMAAGDRDRAVAALADVRKLDPKDELAMVQFVDLSIAGLETVEARQAYAEQVARAAGVPNAVRSHASVQLMSALFQRGQDAAAVKALDQAIALNPLNTTALEARYRMLARTAPVEARIAALAQLIEANPFDARPMISVAQESIANGDYATAANCYLTGFTLLNQTIGGLPPTDDVEDFAAAALLGGQVDAARAWLDALCRASPEDPRLAELSLVAAQVDGKATPEAIENARGLFVTRLAGWSALVKDPSAHPPATRPTPPMPDVAADAKSLKENDPNKVAVGYAAALAELLTFDLALDAAKVDEATVAALGELAGESGAPVVARIDGWRLAKSGAAAEAKAKLTPLAERDGFARLALVAAVEAAGDAAEAKRLAAALLATRPGGLLGALAAVSAKKYDVRPPIENANAEASRRATGARAMVESLLASPRGAYLLTATPAAASFGFGEPILANVTLTNLGGRPVSVGPRGWVGPKFAIDVSPRGSGPLPAAVVDSFAGPIVIAPRQSVTRVVRLDRGAFDAMLRADPAASVTFVAQVVTNPAAGDGGTVPMAGGEATKIGNAIERRGAQAAPARDKLIAALAGGSPAERLAAAEFASAMPPGDAAMRDALNRQSAAESDPLLKLWIGALAIDDTRLIAAAGDPTWAAAAAVASQSRSAQTRRAVAAALPAGEPLLADLGRALVEESDAAPAAPSPTTRP